MFNRLSSLFFFSSQATVIKLIEVSLILFGDSKRWIVCSPFMPNFNQGDFFFPELKHLCFLRFLPFTLRLINDCFSTLNFKEKVSEIPEGTKAIIYTLDDKVSLFSTLTNCLLPFFYSNCSFLFRKQRKWKYPESQVFVNSIDIICSDESTLQLD